MMVQEYRIGQEMHGRELHDGTGSTWQEIHDGTGNKWKDSKCMMGQHIHGMYRKYMTGKEIHDGTENSWWD